MAYIEVTPEQLGKILALESRIKEAMRNEDHCVRSDWCEAALVFTYQALKSHHARAEGRKAHFCLGFDIPKEHPDYATHGGNHCWLKEIPAPAVPLAVGTNVEFCHSGGLFTTLKIESVEYKIHDDEYIYHCGFMAVDLLPISSGKNAIDTLIQLGFRDGDLPEGSDQPGVEPMPDLNFHLVFRSLDKSKPELSQCIVVAPTIEAALSMFGAPANGYEVVTITSQFELESQPVAATEEPATKWVDECKYCGRPIEKRGDKWINKHKHIAPAFCDDGEQPHEPKDNRPLTNPE